MPEGDTIFRAARALQRALAGRQVTQFDANLATLASVADSKTIVGRTVERIEARGKWLLMHFSGLGPQAADQEIILVTHMLMSGSWHIYRVGERWQAPRSAMRCAITCGDFVAVAFHVPVAEFHTARTLERYSQVPRLGVDILSERYDTNAGVAAITTCARQHPEAEVGVTLLNQRVMAGLGNVYKSEVAFAAGVNPFRRLGTLTAREIETMAEFAGRYMRANVAEGSSVTGGERIVTYTGNRRTTHEMDRNNRLWVYSRQGQECRRCGALIMMRKQGEQVRSTYWCPQCQPWVAAEGQSPTPPSGDTQKGLTRGRNSC